MLRKARRLGPLGPGAPYDNENPKLEAGRWRASAQARAEAETQQGRALKLDNVRERLSSTGHPQWRHASDALSFFTT